MKESIKVTFYCREQTARNGKSPVEVCVNVRGKRTVFRIDKYYAPAEFKKKRQSQRTNDVKELCAGIQAKFAEIQGRFPGLSAEDYKRYYIEGTPLERSGNLTVDTMCREYLDTVAKGRTTERHYRNSLNAFCEKYGRVRALDVTTADIKAFLTGLELADSTRHNYFKHVKSVFDWAFQKRYVEHNPFAGFRMTFKSPDPVYLTQEELNRIAWLPLNGRLERVRDLFLFLCGSGLEYADALALEPDDVKCKDGIWYIQKKRVKTGVEYTAILINSAMDVWSKYEGLLPIPSNQQTNKALKEIATLAGIRTSVKLSTIVARHCYATSLLSGTYHLAGSDRTQPITIDVLRRCLGHQHYSMSMVYASLLDESLFNAFKPKEGPAGSQRVREK